MIKDIPDAQTMQDILEDVTYLEIFNNVFKAYVQLGIMENKPLQDKVWPLLGDISTDYIKIRNLRMAR